jgi:hypothetical protein
MDSATGKPTKELQIPLSRPTFVEMSTSTISPDSCPPLISESPIQTPTARLAGTSMPVIPLMSKEEGERLISQMPKRSLEEALEMMEKVLGRPMPLVEGGMPK